MFFSVMSLSPSGTKSKFFTHSFLVFNCKLCSWFRSINRASKPGLNLGIFRLRQKGIKFKLGDVGNIYL